MKRVLSAIIILVLTIPMLVFSQTILLNLIVALISAASLYEALIVTKYVENRQFIVCSLTMAVVVPFLGMSSARTIALLLFVFIVAMFVMIIVNIKTVHIEHISVIFMLSVIIPYFFSNIVAVRRSEPFGAYYIYLIFIAAWFTDTGAYLIGKLFGRHKLCPSVSPKKTVEGAIGGVIGSALGFVLFGWCVQTWFPVTVNFPILMATSVVASVIAQIGDLSASAIKRAFGVKDFGNLIPGHGGVLDRFDSVLFVAPFLRIVIEFIPFLSF